MTFVAVKLWVYILYIYSLSLARDTGYLQGNWDLSVTLEG